MLNGITALLDENLERVDNLVSLYGPAVVGRRKVHDTDVLRAAVVLLHAGMEDYLRSLLAWKIDTFGAEALNGYSFSNGKPKIGLGELSGHRGLTVDELIMDVIKTHLEEFQSFNNLGEVKKALKQCGIANETVDAHAFNNLPEMIARRHNIVHKADRNDVVGGRGNHTTKSLGLPSVEKYVQSVKSLRDFVTEQLGTA